MLKVAYADEPSKTPSYINASVRIVSHQCEQKCWSPFPLPIFFQVPSSLSLRLGNATRPPTFESVRA